MRKFEPSVLLAVLWMPFLTVSAVAGQLTDETEVGMVITGGNSKSSTLHVKQANVLESGSRKLKFGGNYLNTTTRGILDARSWLLALRYEQAFRPSLGFYLGQGVESNIFAGYVQRWNSDAGAQAVFIKEPKANWLGEVGYRYTIENGILGNQEKSGFLRFFTEVSREFKANVSGKIAAEFLPRLSQFSDYRLNLEPSIQAMLNEWLSLKVGYEIRYINEPLPGAQYKTDTVFSTALVAKF
ncbi:MAG: DUF481 domain-containing protein [Bdellovibrionales bacterium]|nr:DUF481 domain-containing protein [Bdellovibrionales bacterium]